MSSNRQLIVCSLEDWDHVWRRNQYLVDSLMLHDPDVEVLFIEPAADPVHALVNGRPARRGRGLSVVDGYEGRLRTLQPTKFLPRRLGSAADSFLVRSALAAVRRLRWTSPLLWINDPDWLPLLRSTGWPTLYDITDDWVAADRSDREHERLVRDDTALLELSAEVVVCSQALVRSKGLARHVSLIPNAVELERYRRPHERPTDLPAQPVAVYVGTLHEDRLDVDLVESVAHELASAGACLVLVGPNALTPHNTERLAAAPGVLVLGARSRDSIPAYLQHAHVLVVPHVIDDFTDSLNPIKLYEYLAVGRPIVSTGVAGFRELAGAEGILIGDNQRFVAGVLDGVARWASGIMRDGVPDWSDRGNAMLEVLERLATVPRAD